MSEPQYPMTPDAFYCVDAETTKQTIAESKITHSIDLGRSFTIHHGTRDGLPIVIFQCEGQKLSELSCVWYDESISERTGNLIQGLTPVATGKPDLSNYAIETDSASMTVYRLKAAK